MILIYTKREIKKELCGMLEVFNSIESMGDLESKSLDCSLWNIAPCVAVAGFTHERTKNSDYSW